MQIYGPTHLHGPQPIRAPHNAQPARPAESASTLTPRDEVEISSSAQLIDQVHQLPEIRQDRVQELRQAIASGSYETEAKLDAAIDRLLDEIA
jgi:negative regulator of flagellin synthesis FlgM